MKNLLLSFVPAFIFVALWFSPIYLAYRVARESRKNTSLVLLGGLFLGWLGAFVVVLILPTMTEAQFEDFERPKVSRRGGSEMDFTKFVMYGLGVCALGLGAMVYLLSEL